MQQSSRSRPVFGCQDLVILRDFETSKYQWLKTCQLRAHLPAAKKKDKERLIAGLTIGRRKLQLKCKFCFALQRSFADKFSGSWAFFLHEQRLSLRLPLSVLSDIIISLDEQFLFCLFIPFSLQ